MRPASRRLASGLLLVPLLWSAAAGCRDRGNDPLSALAGVLAVEDVRPGEDAGRRPLLDALTDRDPVTRVFAVRAIGRLEDPALVPALRPALDDPDPTVRGEAAWALAQAVYGADGTPALRPLLDAAGRETDPGVRGELARSLGRIRPGGSAPEGVLAVLAPWVEGASLPPETAVGVALGLEGLSRAPGATASDARVYELLERLAGYRPSGVVGSGAGAGAPLPTTGSSAVGTTDPAEAAARVRSVAILGLGQRGRLPATTLRAGLADPNGGVRASAARFLRAAPETERPGLTVSALGDAETIVRIEAVRSVAGGARDSTSCTLLFDVARNDESVAVRLVAIDALADPCPPEAGLPVLAHLSDVASSLPAAGPGARAWQPAAHALRALARTAPERARPLLAIHAAHDDPFVRGSAAAVANALGDTPTLRALAADPVPNVRTAALPGLRRLDGAAADEVLLAQLRSDDPWLLLTASELLLPSVTTENRTVAEAAFEAFSRLSADRRETARDPRLALLALVRAAGTEPLVASLEPYLADYDAVVAETVSELLGSWTGRNHPARSVGAAPLPHPTVAELRELEETLVVLHMARGGEIVVQPLPRLAPTNAHRFARLAREGHFDGLTFHRWVPNFVIQGGSPGANEYAGDGPYTRDEIGRLSHWRGTVGLSTRGRDTGDGQIFVNLVHNVRLDHDYTVFGLVAAGFETVDQVLEGDVIQRVEIRRQD